MAPTEPMPRYSLYRSPCTITTSPGDSSTPASSLPSITVSAPGRDGLGDVAGVLDAAVGDDRHAAAAGAGAVERPR